MKTQGRTPSLAALAIALMLPLAACHSNNAANQNPDSQPQASPAQPQPQAAAPAQPQAEPSAGTAGAGPAPETSRATTPRPPEAINLPEGTTIRVRLDTDLGSKISNEGDTFSATVADDVEVNGRTVIEKGARADGTVTDAKALGRFKGGAELAVKLDRVTTRWGSYPVETSSISRAEKGKGKRTGVMAGGGAGLGALIGGLAGGGKGAAIGALAGAGAGTAGSAFTGNKEIVLPAETLLTFKLEHAVRVREDRR
jgi:hypothetical protein